MFYISSGKYQKSVLLHMAKAVIVNSKDVLTLVIGLGLYYYVKWHICHLTSQIPGSRMRNQKRKNGSKKEAVLIASSRWRLDVPPLGQLSD